MAEPMPVKFTQFYAFSRYYLASKFFTTGSSINQERRTVVGKSSDVYCVHLDDRFPFFVSEERRRLRDATSARI